VITRRSPVRVALAHLAYNLLFHTALLMAVAPWLVRLARDRRQWGWTLGRLGRLPKGRPDGPTIWVHAVSVGEVKASRTLLAALRERASGATVVLSTGTITGLETAAKLFPDVYVFPWPLDVPWVTASVLRRMAPRMLLMVELELWPSLSRQADKAGVPQAIVNGRVTESSYRTYRRFRWWLPEFDRLSLVAAQTDEYAGRIANLGVPGERVHVTGSLKHDRPHDGEDLAVIDAWLAAGGAGASRLIIVPRHLDRVKEIGRLLRRKEVSWVLRSECTVPRDPSTVLLVDSMGELEGLFALADVVFLGGSLVPVGGHNVLEPAAARRPVLTGPWLETCRLEADVLEAAGGLEIVEDASDLGRALARLLSDEELREKRGMAAWEASQELAGATQRTLQLLDELDLPGGRLLDPKPQSDTVADSKSIRTSRSGASSP